MDFSAVAPYYRASELVLAGGVLQRMREYGLPLLPAAPQVLIVGDGHGRSLEALLASAPGAAVTIVEKSMRMIEVARARLLRRGLSLARVQWDCADIRGWDAAQGAYDVIVTHFVLDCFIPRDVGAVVEKLGRLARPDAVWLLADFCIPAHGWRRLRARAIHRLMYAFFRRVVALEARALTVPDPALRQAGFVLHRRRWASAGLLHSDVWVRGGDFMAG